MLSGYWQIASVLVLVLFVSPPIVLSDSQSSALNHKNSPSEVTRIHQNPVGRQDYAAAVANLNRIRDSESTTESPNVATVSNHQRDWERRQANHLDQTQRNSRRLYNRIRDVKRSLLDQRNLDNENSRVTKRVRVGGRFSDAISLERLEKPDTLRDRLTHRFPLPTSEENFDPSRVQRRFSLFRDEIRHDNRDRLASRFERLQKFRMLHMNPDQLDSDESRIISRFERIRKNRLNRNDDGTIDVDGESLTPRHFRNFRKMHQSLGRQESSFDRRNAYITQARNQVRIANDIVRADKSEPRFEIQRQQREKLLTELNSGNRTTESILKERQIRKEQRREMEDQLIEEEKQYIVDERQRVLEEARLERERQHKFLETERKVNEIVRKIQESERMAREERNRLQSTTPATSTTTDSTRQKTYDDRNTSKFGDKVWQQYDFVNAQDYYDYSDYVPSAEEESYVIIEDKHTDPRRRLLNDVRHFSDIRRQVRENAETLGKDYLDTEELFSFESDEYEDSEEDDDEEQDEVTNSRHYRERRQKRSTNEKPNRNHRLEDVRLFSDIRRQVRDNAEKHGKEYLDTKELLSEEVEDFTNEDDTRRNLRRVDHVSNRNENKTGARRQKRSVTNERHRFRNTEVKQRENTKRDHNNRQRQIVENRSFRSQEERHIRRVNLRQMNDNKRFVAAIRQKNELQNRKYVANERRENRLNEYRRTIERTDHSNRKIQRSRQQENESIQRREMHNRQDIIEERQETIDRRILDKLSNGRIESFEMQTQRKIAFSDEEAQLRQRNNENNNIQQSRLGENNKISNKDARRNDRLENNKFSEREIRKDGQQENEGQIRDQRLDERQENDERSRVDHRFDIRQEFIDLLKPPYQNDKFIFGLNKTPQLCQTAFIGLLAITIFIQKETFGKKIRLNDAFGRIIGGLHYIF